MSRRPSASIVANPVLVGAVTTLVVVVAVFLAYNANNGLPFVPTREIKVDVGSGSNLVKGNEVREGGFRIGVVETITPIERAGQTIAQLRLKLDKTVGNIPADTTIKIRPRSALGLKYVEFTRGQSKRYLKDGDTIPISQTNVPVQFDEIFKIFDRPTRTASEQNLEIFGSGFAARGSSVNELIVQLRPLLRYLPPVAANLVDPNTQLVRFFRELGDFTRIVAPVADVNARLFTDMATTFEAFSRDPQALRDTIGKSPRTLTVGTRSLHDQRPFLHDFLLFSRDLRPAARDLRAALPTISDALETGTPVLIRTIELNGEVRDTLATVKDFTETPTTNQSLRALQATVGILNPLVRFLGPYQTVCNYWNYFWTYLGEHIGGQDVTGTAQRANINTAPAQINGLGSEGAYEPANKETTPNQRLQNMLTGEPVNGAAAHGQAYGAAIDNQGRADCENGQRGYPSGPLAQGVIAHHPNDAQGNPFLIVSDPHTPGNQGPTYTGRDRVPKGETFSREPEAPPDAQLPSSLTTGIYGG